MNKYQMIIQFVPDIKEEVIDEYIEKAQKITELTRIDKWGHRRYVYKVEGNNGVNYRTYYSVCCNVLLDDETKIKIEKLFKTNDIIRVMIVRSC